MRPKRYKIETVAEALRAASGLRTHAAKMLGCAPTTVTNYVERSAYLREVEQEARDVKLDLAEAKLHDNIVEGKEQSLFFFLRCKGRERGWVDKQTVETSGPGGGPVEMVHRVAPDYASMSDEDLDAAIAERTARL